MCERKPRGTQAKDVISCRLGVIDIDPVRPKNTSSSLEQLNKAMDVAMKIKKWFVSNNFESPSIGMSGNGYQVWYSHTKVEVNDNNREEVTQVRKKFEAYLRDKFATEEVSIDSIHDLPRIIKVIGVISIKGDNHRMSHWVEYNDKTDSNLWDYMKALPDLETKKYVYEEPRKKTPKEIKKEGASKDYSRSGKEWAEICRRIEKGLRTGDLSKANIYSEMNLFSKWNTAPEAYKDKTWQKAYDFVLKQIEEKNKIDVEDPKRHKNSLIKSKIYELMADKKRREATEYLAQIIQKDMAIYTVRDDVFNEMWFYDASQGIYIPNGKTYIKENLRFFSGTHYTGTFANEVIDKIAADTFIDASDFFDAEPKDQICVKNGILDLTKNKLYPFDSDIPFFTRIPVNYDPSKDCPVFKRHLRTIFQDEESVDVMQEVLGYCLYKEMFIEKFILMEGNGRNGKSKTSEALQKFLGTENCQAIPWQKLCNEQYATSELHKKLANITPDMEKNDLNNTGIFKSLTGRDLISAPRKFKSNVTFCNYAKLIAGCNEIPTTGDMSDAFFERAIILNFPFKFVDSCTYENLDDEEKKRCKIKDIHILEKMTTDEELSGILNYALEGLKRLLKNKKFSYNKSTTSVKKLWLMKTNSLKVFCDEYIKEDFEGYIAKQEFKNAYKKYCRLHKATIMNDKKIKQFLENEYGVDSKEKQAVVGDKFQRANCWVGINFGGINK